MRLVWYLLPMLLWGVVAGCGDNGSTETIYVATPNEKPVAVAGDTKSINVWENVNLSGNGSHDPDGDILGYQWTIVSRPDGSTAHLSEDISATPTFTPDLSGDYVISLTVHDGRLYSDPSFVTITATPYTASSVDTDPAGIVRLTSSSFTPWYQTATNGIELIKFTFSTTDAQRHSFTAYFAGLDSHDNVVYSSYISGPAPEVFQTSASVDLARYASIVKWVVTSITVNS